MRIASYIDRRSHIQTYFDRTALDAWRQLTSDAPVSKIRATVRAGRDRMRSILLDWLPRDLHGRRLLDAGCGTGALSCAAARRGADVIAVDVSGSLIEIAENRTPGDLKGLIAFRVADMLNPRFGTVDHVVAMDSLIHYETADIIGALLRLAPRVTRSIAFTVAPRTPLLAIMHTVGRLFPRKDRAPAIVPVDIKVLRRRIAAEPGLQDWRIGRSERVTTGFYMSHAVELVRT